MNTIPNRQNVAIIINPVAGGKSNKISAKVIQSLLPASIKADYYIWETVDQRDEIAQKVKEGNYEIVVAVGGDGTVNFVGSTVLNTNTALAIIPIGSGNGLARQLGIPLSLEKAITLIGNGNISTIDSGELNGHPFFCTAGVGFDAHIGKLFAESTKRGFSTYFKITSNELRKYRPKDYTISVDGKSFTKKAFLLTMANAGQYGNNAWIAPQADIRDGLLDLCMIKPFKFYQVPLMARQLFNRKIQSSPVYESYRSKEIIISREDPGPVHYDGEPAGMGTELRIRVRPESLRVVVP